MVSADASLLQVRMRSGTKQGSKHIQLGYNNQDARLDQAFFVPAFKKTFRVGLVSDGCSGYPSFSRTEVGANLLTIYAYRRIQEMLCSGMTVHETVKALYPSITEFTWNLANMIMPATVVWPYPAKLKDRDTWSSQTRFQRDYLAATLLGFIEDGQDVVTFTAGDGMILINDDLTIIDQDDKPDYPAISVNRATTGFVTSAYKASDIRRIALMSDGLKHLIKRSGFVNEMFGHKLDQPLLGLQFFLNITYNNHPELMDDDCTVVTWEKLASPSERGTALCT